MNTYVLIEGNHVETNWYELIDKKDKQKIERLIERYSKTLTMEYINGRQGLDLERMEKFLWMFTHNLNRYLEEGRTLLFNQTGGMMFLDHHVHIIKKIEDNYFPITKENVGLSGWLTPNGEFYRCEHGEHWKFAQMVEKKERDELVRMQYIPMGSLGYECEKFSHLYIPLNGLTVEQEKWFETNYPYLDPKQKEIYHQQKELVS